MSLTVDQQQAQIVEEVGDPYGTVAPVVVAVWAFYSDKTAIDSRLTYLYVKRAALDVRLAEEQQSTNVKVGGDDIQDQEASRFDHVQTMRDTTQAEIVRIEAMARARRVPAQGALTTVEPMTPLFPDQPDATDPLYTGSPYRPPWLRW